MLVRRLADWPRFDPRELDRLRRDLDDFVRGTRSAGSGVYPPLNVSESGESYFVRAELPGMERDAIEIAIDGEQLAISGERKIAVEAEGTRYHRRERAAGRFSRVLRLPGDTESDAVKARYEQGVLTIELPKAETARPRTITVE